MEEEKTKKRTYVHPSIEELEMDCVGMLAVSKYNVTIEATREGYGLEESLDPTTVSVNTSRDGYGSEESLDD